MEIEEMLAAMKLAEGRALGRAERAAELLTTWLRLEVGELDAGIERRIASTTTTSPRSSSIVCSSEDGCCAWTGRR